MTATYPLKAYARMKAASNFSERQQSITERQEQIWEAQIFVQNFLELRRNPWS